jgi:hypothetical protein
MIAAMLETIEAEKEASAAEKGKTEPGTLEIETIETETVGIETTQKEFSTSSSEMAHLPLLVVQTSVIPFSYGKNSH